MFVRRGATLMLHLTDVVPFVRLSQRMRAFLG
jgi:hypothetical protein